MPLIVTSPIQNLDLKTIITVVNIGVFTVLKIKYQLNPIKLDITKGEILDWSHFLCNTLYVCYAGPFD